MTSKNVGIIDRSCSIHQYDVGYMCGLEWALSLIDMGLSLHELRLYLSAKSSNLSDRLQAGRSEFSRSKRDCCRCVEAKKEPRKPTP